MKFKSARMVQSLFNRAGYQIRRLEKGVSYGDPISEIERLAGGDIRRVVEVGAADGRDTIAFANRFVGAQITAFEPLPENFAKLAEKAAGSPRVQAINAAVADRGGRSVFHMSALADASSLLQPVETASTFDKYMAPTGQIEVDTVTLDEWAVKEGVDRIDILKMDAQGSELAILRGASRLTREHRFGVIYSEVLFMPIYRDAPLYHDIARHLQDNGYHLHNLYNLIHNQKGELAWGDAIFILNH